MAEVDNLIFGFHEEFLAVNSPSSAMQLRHQADLHFSIMNASDTHCVFDGNAASKIELRVNIGEGSSNMFTVRDAAGYGTIQCAGGFTTQGWYVHPLKKNQLLCTIKSEIGKVLILAPAKALSFTWAGITSTAAEGYTAMTVTLTNVLGQQDTKLTCSILKKQANMNIANFFASPSTGARGQKVRLNWSIENALRGTVLPGGHSIIGPQPQKSSSMEIVLDDDVDCYYLNLEDNLYGAFERANVFVMPPVITGMEIKDGKLCWETHFANRVELAQGNGYAPVEDTGNRTLNKGVTMVSLRCCGLYVVKRTMYVPPDPEINTFSLEIQQFNSHMSATLYWDTVGLKTVALNVWDTDVYTISTRPKGIWEQVYAPQTNLIFSLNYTTAKEEKTIKIWHENSN